ncbi:MAG: cysteine hydrolase family protein [Desulfovibrio sp.]|uniref:cysteine hydrolase family protein n=1 Tax=Desulfovibrio sp. 7SRBS1 TaxID=3378064 RepID=UPI003B4039E9
METTALLIIDIQNDYFPGGRYPLPGAEQAGAQAEQLLAYSRAEGLPIVHVRHESLQEGATFFIPGTSGAEIHECAAPQEGETVLVKHRPNSFLGTGLDDVLRARGVKRLVICGMMTNMCVDAGVRAAADLGYECVLVHDACAAANLSFGGVDVPAAQVQAAYMAALSYGYAQVAETGTITSLLR